MLTVVHSDTVFENRPTNSPTVEELIVYLLQEEIRNTAKLGEFSGADCINNYYATHFFVSVTYTYNTQQVCYKCSSLLEVSSIQFSSTVKNRLAMVSTSICFTHVLVVKCSSGRPST